MKKVQSLIAEHEQAHRAGKPERITEDTPGLEEGERLARVDAINRMFAEFELAYHNQFHKAWPDDASRSLAKKYWYSALNGFSPSVLLKATRLVTTTQTFLPTLSAMVSACENGMRLLGLSSARDAYREACLAPHPKSAQAWTHPAVYLAGQACDWFALASQPEEAMLPLFEYHYRALCNQALNGEELRVPKTKALPESVPAKPLTPEQQKDKLEALRKSLGI